jgi:hypothetical protein
MCIMSFKTNYKMVDIKDLNTGIAINTLQSQSLKGSIPPAQQAASKLGLQRPASVKKVKSQTLDPVRLKVVVIQIKDVIKTLNSVTKILSQTRFEKECDHLDAYTKALIDITTRSSGLLTKVEKSVDESQRILKSKVSKPVK